MDDIGERCTVLLQNTENGAKRHCKTQKMEEYRQDSSRRQDNKKVGIEK
jgi:hypothetical protein